MSRLLEWRKNANAVEIPPSLPAKAGRVGQCLGQLPTPSAASTTAGHAMQRAATTHLFNSILLSFVGPSTTRQAIQTLARSLCLVACIFLQGTASQSSAGPIRLVIEPTMRVGLIVGGLTLI